MSEQSHVSVRQTIDGLLAKQRQTSSSNLGTMLQQLKYIIEMLFELTTNILALLTCFGASSFQLCVATVYIKGIQNRVELSVSVL